MHNKSRKLANGKPTFDKIWENILMMHRSDCEFGLMIRIHFTIENYEMLSSLIQRINQTLAGDQRIKIFFKIIVKVHINHLKRKDDRAIYPTI